MGPQNQRLDREYDDEGDVSPAETNDFNGTIARARPRIRRDGQRIL